jgi:uncharacterized protein (TIGR02466 family)
MDTLNLFPTPVGMSFIDKDFTANELAFVRNQKQRPNMGNTTSVDTQILDATKMKRIRKFVELKTNEFFQQIYQPADDVSIYLTQSWLNYTTKGQWHHKHTHANSIISGVLYINANKDSDRINFYRREFPAQIEVYPQDWNPWNSNSWWVETYTGMLVLFPSTLAHDVSTVEHDDERISLSFNTFVRGNLGAANDLTHLHVK